MISDFFFRYQTIEISYHRLVQALRLTKEPMKITFGFQFCAYSVCLKRFSFTITLIAFYFVKGAFDKQRF